MAGNNGWKLNRSALTAGIEALKRRISDQVSPFEDQSDAEQKRRIKRAQRDLMFFGRTYLPHYCTHKPSVLHKDLCRRYERIVLDPAPQKAAIAAPRGNAKSTWTTLILPLWCIVFKRKHFIAIFSNSLTQAADFLDFIKAELESNERLQHDFPRACGEGPTWKYGTAVTANGIKLRAWGVRQKLLGARHLQWRPDLCIYDDLEDPEELLNPENRKKNEAWFFRKAINIGNVQYTDHIIVGTVLHTDALLPKLIDMYGGATYRSIITWSKSPLWTEWEAIYTADPDPKRPLARAFFERNRDEMLAGTEVLWPEGESYYDLMCLRQDIGTAAFDAEKQNNPTETGWFREEWLLKWAYEPADLIGKNLTIYGACDPSLGRTDGAPSAIIILGRDQSTGTSYVLEADIKRRQPSEILEDIIEHQRRYKCVSWVVEEVQFQEYLRTQIVQESMRAGVPVPARGVRPHKDKHLRIQSLQPYLMQGVIRLPRIMRARRDDQMSLWAQLIHYPRAAFLDGPDALEMAVSSIRASGAQRMVTRRPRESRQIVQGF